LGKRRPTQSLDQAQRILTDCQIYNSTNEAQNIISKIVNVLYLS